MLTGHREEVSVVGGHIHRLFDLSRRFDPIEIPFNAEGLVQSSSVFQVQFAWAVDLEANLQMRRLPSLYRP